MCTKLRVFTKLGISFYRNDGGAVSGKDSSKGRNFCPPAVPEIIEGTGVSDAKRPSGDRNNEILTPRLFAGEFVALAAEVEDVDVGVAGEVVAEAGDEDLEAAGGDDFALVLAEAVEDVGFAAR